MTIRRKFTKIESINYIERLFIISIKKYNQRIYENEMNISIRHFFYLLSKIYSFEWWLMKTRDDYASRAWNVHNRFHEIRQFDRVLAKVYKQISWQVTMKDCLLLYRWYYILFIHLQIIFTRFMKSFDFFQ